MISISVAIPSYNHSRYLGSCIESVQRQTLPPKEVVVVDDGSTDDFAGCDRVLWRNHTLLFAG